MKTRTLIVCLLVSSLAIVANATLIDFESVPENQSLQVSNQFVGDTYDILGVDLWSKTSGLPRWKNNVYANNSWFIIGDNNGHIGMDFVIPMSEVSMDLMAMSSAKFWVYDENYVPINGVTSIVLGFNVWKNKTIIAPTGRLISRIEVKGTVSNAVLAMDNLTFVPEPATMLLMFGALPFLRRRKA